MTDLWITVDRRPAATVVAARGKIMYDTRAPLDQVFKEILSEPTPQVVLDLHEVLLCDSSGLQLLLDAQRHAIAAGGWLRLCRPRPIVARVLEVTNLVSILPVYESLDAAVSAPA